MWCSVENKYTPHYDATHIFTTSLSVTVVTQDMTDAGSSGLFSNDTHTEFRDRWYSKEHAIFYLLL